MNYKDKTQQQYYLKLNELLSSLPDFCRTYFIGRENRLSQVTAVSYAYNLTKFFEYLHANNSYFSAKDIQSIKLDDMAKLTSEDIEEFLHWMRYHETDGKTFNNKQSTLEHYLSSISELYSYYIKRGHLSTNPVDAIDRTVRKKKKIIRLENNEKTIFTDAVKYGTGLSPRQQKFHEKNKQRDLAIVTVFLNTGIRVSELVGINIPDINFDNHSISIIRKGGNQQYVYFSDKTETVLQEYLTVRHLYHPMDTENALFLSKTGERISIRSVQKLVKKYAQSSLPGKTDAITPHKLRSTFATDMLRATNDIELVSEQLGHANLQTTRIYADYDENKRSDARNILDDKT